MIDFWFEWKPYTIWMTTQNATFESYVHMVRQVFLEVQQIKQ